MTTPAEQEKAQSPASERPRSFFARNSATNGNGDESEGSEKAEAKPTRWSMGVLNDRATHEVPGSVLLLTGKRNEPLGLRNAPARISTSSIPISLPVSPAPASRRPSHKETGDKKLTKDGQIILEPQPDDSGNDPLNWPSWRRDAALLSLGLYCMLGGGMTPILAAGFTNVAATYDVTTAKVALTTGLYMMGLGVGSVFASPTAILYGKRPVYLGGAVLFIATAVWCAVSPSYTSLLVARVVQGMSLSPVECLPSATIAEIFFLHERAYRIGIYTLLLLGGKNLVPLVSAAIIQSLGWRWVFWIVTIVAGFCLSLLFLFVPETFWDRTPRPKSHSASRNASRLSLFSRHRKPSKAPSTKHGLERQTDGGHDEITPATPTVEFQEEHATASKRPHRSLHVGFAPNDDATSPTDTTNVHETGDHESMDSPKSPLTSHRPVDADTPIPEHEAVGTLLKPHPILHKHQDRVMPAGGCPATPGLHNFNSPYYDDIEKNQSDYLGRGRMPSTMSMNNDGGNSHAPVDSAEGSIARLPRSQRYTADLRTRPNLTFIQQLKPFNGRLHYDNWFHVAVRPFILYAYPAVLWSSIVYACSIGWLIVLSESVAVVFRAKDTYGFSALSTGLVYISPFVGGILGTAVAGKLSDVIVRAMSRRNGGLYEPEFRLVMAIPVTITTVIGLMGFGWSAQIHDAWIVPTIFFGVISFGCSLGSTTAITFCVDSYRQYAGEALVTLNFTKNICHGLVFSLFFTSWLESDGSKTVFIWVGVIQLICMAFTVPMYIFGKRARMWTVRKNLMEKF